jgi:L-rhamnonate dehydratase
MKITQVEALLLRGEQAYQTHASADEASDLGQYQMLVRVATDEGLTGWSDCETLGPAAIAVINGQGLGVMGFKTMRELLVGRDPLAVEANWDHAYIGSNYYGRRGLAMQCLSAIDNCLWSIRAQAAGLPLHSLLGGARVDRLPAYASTLYRDTPAGNAEAARGYLARGFRAIKFGWGVLGEDPGRDVEAAAAIREAIGPERDFMLDPGWYSVAWKGPWRPRSERDNHALCQRFAPYRPLWLEDFIHPEDYEQYARVRAASPVPIAAGEQLATHWDFERFMRGRGSDFIQPDLSRCGGLTVARKIVALAEQLGQEVVCHSWLSDLLHGYSLHLACTLARPRFLEFNVSQSPLTRGICGGALSLNPDGTVSLPSGSGLGLSVDEDFIRHHRVASA